MGLKTILEQSNLKMSHRGYVLVLVPLLLGLMLLGILLALLNQAEIDSKREAHSRTVISMATALSSHATNGVQSLIAYVLTRSNTLAERYDAEMGGLPNEFKELANQTRDDPEESKLVERMRIIMERGAVLLNTVRNTNDEEFTPNDVYYVSGLRTHLTYLLQHFLMEQRKLIAYEEGHCPSGQASDAMVRQRLKEAIAIGIVIEVVASLMLAVFFSRTVTSRVMTLLDNTVRFQNRKDLNPTLKGGDELAQLDGVFHNMAVERNQAEKLIKQNEHRVRSILEEMPVALMVTNEAGHIEATNIRADDMLGYPGGTLIGSQVGALFLSDGKDVSSFMTEIVPKAFGQSQELSANRKNGKDLPIELSVSRLEMMDGPRLLVTMLDITQRREIERLKQEFVNMISHDLKTPLTSIVGNLALVAADAFGPLSERGKQIVDSSEKQTMRLINMINDLLLLEKMDAGGFELYRTRVDVSDLVEQAIESVCKAAADHSVTIEATDTAAFIEADGMRLQQVLVNLLSNAIKFSPSREMVRLDVEETTDWLTFRVIDKGRGIPEEHRQSIFEKFKQVELSDFRDKGGTGLGLPICKVIVEKHGGKIGVDSDPGEGSTFWFRLPKN